MLACPAPAPALCLLTRALACVQIRVLQYDPDQERLLSVRSFQHTPEIWCIAPSGASEDLFLTVWSRGTVPGLQCHAPLAISMPAGTRHQGWEQAPATMLHCPGMMRCFRWHIWSKLVESAARRNPLTTSGPARAPDNHPQVSAWHSALCLCALTPSGNLVGKNKQQLCGTFTLLASGACMRGGSPLRSGMAVHLSDCLRCFICTWGVPAALQAPIHHECACPPRVWPCMHSVAWHTQHTEVALTVEESGIRSWTIGDQGVQVSTHLERAKGLL